MTDGDRKYPHLNDEAVRALSLPDSERIRKIWDIKHDWIPYDLAKEAFKIANQLLARSPAPRLPCLLVYGEPNSGKTSLLVQHSNRNPIDQNPEGETTRASVIRIEVDGPDLGLFYSAILEAIGARFNKDAKWEKKRNLAMYLLPKVGILQLLIDELSTAISGPTARQRKFMVELKYFLNRLQITAFATGTKEAKIALAVDSQMESRWILFELPPWRRGDEFRRLLESFERRIPLKEASRLQRPSIADKVHDMTEGYIGEVAELLMRCAVLAIETKKEKIDLEILGQINWTAPSQRRTLARQL